MCAFDWEIDERMMIFTNYARIESQTEEIELEKYGIDREKERQSLMQYEVRKYG